MGQLSGAMACGEAWAGTGRPRPIGPDANCKTNGKIRFGLSTDGMSPFREMRNPHSTWPVIMCIFNLPPWLCHKQKYLFLTTLISGPKQASNDIDAFLEPLMEDMYKLWEYGVTMWDEYNKQHLNLKAIIFYTINDNPTRLSLTWQVKGKT
jgi:hypothetical protein